MLPPLQLQSQLHTMDFGKSDVEDLFINGPDGQQDTADNWWYVANKLPPSLMDPVLSEMLTRGEPVKGQGNIAVGPVSSCHVCDQNHEISRRSE